MWTMLKETYLVTSLLLIATNQGNSSTMESTTVSTASITTTGPVFVSLSVRRGPIGGGTTIVGKGRRLMNSNISSIYFRGVGSATIDAWSDDEVTFRSPPFWSPGLVAIDFELNSTNSTYWLWSGEYFEYLHNPVVFGIQKAPYQLTSGGSVLNATGFNLDSVVQPLLRTVVVLAHSRESSCTNVYYSECRLITVSSTSSRPMTSAKPTTSLSRVTSANTTWSDGIYYYPIRPLNEQLRDITTSENPTSSVKTESSASSRPTTSERPTTSASRVTSSGSTVTSSESTVTSTRQTIDQTMTCVIPDLNLPDQLTAKLQWDAANNRSTAAKEEGSAATLYGRNGSLASVYVGFTFDGYRRYENLTDPKAGLTLNGNYLFLNFIPPPVINQSDEVYIYDRRISDTITILGERLDTACSYGVECEVSVGGENCQMTDITSNAITCIPPMTQPKQKPEDLCRSLDSVSLSIQIRIGFRFYRYRCLRYYTLDVGFIVALSAGLAIPFVIVFIALFCVCRKRRKKSPDKSAECSLRHLASSPDVDGSRFHSTTTIQADPDPDDPGPQVKVGPPERRPDSPEDNLYMEAIFKDDTGYLRPVDDAQVVRRWGGGGGGGAVLVRGSDRATYYPPRSLRPNREPEKMEKEEEEA